MWVSSDLEQRVLDFWEGARCFEKRVEKNRGKPRWSFLDGPITANNPMGVHHAWGRTYKDIFQRYHAMTGHELRYQNGFDCQGLWVEVEVEKELGFTSKRDIEAYGIGRFVEKCKERVQRFAAIQTEQSKRLGYWMDWDNSYFTMSDENNYTIWEFLKKCHQRGLIYHGYDAMPWCPRCGTGISQHEISSEERPLVVHTSPTVKFPLRGRPGEFLLVWTTTPWTLTSNVACAVHPELTYIAVKQNGEIYYLVKERLEAVVHGHGRASVLREIPGKELVGWPYDGPFDELAAQEGVKHRIIPWKEVSSAEGTGVVHIAPGCGKEDYELGREFDLPAIGPIDESGVFLEGFGPYTGLQATAAAEAIFDALRKKGILYGTEDYEHAYPICWRCKTHLLFRLVDEWYISMNRLRHEIIEVTEQTRWIPEMGKRLELDWLDNMHDWMISKKRYWGLALPIYHCEACGAFDVLGGKEELRQRAVKGWQEFEGHSPHRPWIDAVVIACSSCGAHVPRVADVGNPWLDAGIVPYSTMHYNTDRSYWEKWFPADWISESYPGQFRNWFYAILAMSTVMEKRPPFKLIFGYRTMKDETGEEMHKSKGNAIEFNEAAEEEGADAMRWLFASHNPDYDLRFGYHRIHEARRELLTLWNVYQFFRTYATIDKFKPSGKPLPLGQRSLLDRWLLQLLERLVGSAHEHFGSYSVHLFMRELKSFVDALSRWYLRRSRRRFWKSDDDEDKLAAYQTLWESLVTLSKLLAPVIPFITEEMYHQLVRNHDDDAPVSVHLCDFPERGPTETDESLLAEMAVIQALVELGHAARHAANLKVRQPLAEMIVAGKTGIPPERLKPLLPLLEDELNVKVVRFVNSADEVYSPVLKLDAELCGPKYKGKFPALQQALAAAEPEEVAERISRRDAVMLKIDGQAIEIPAGEILLEQKSRDGWEVAQGGGFTVALNTSMTRDLLREGQARDLVRQIQELRKALALHVADRIRITYAASDEAATLLNEYRDHIAGETLAVDLTRAGSLSPNSHVVVIGDHTVKLKIERSR